MRIIGGTYRGRIFTPDKKFSARPTTDLAKEALFNILTNRYEWKDLRVLDLFSGTGSIGYEFISRGADHVTFVEKNRSHVQFIRETLAKLEITRAHLVQEDVFRFLTGCKQPFDIVFADPPFNLPELTTIPGHVFNSGVITENTLLILEHPGSFNFSEHSYFRECRNYGKVHFSFFIRKE
jgi:16S rRNA (guanine966-N2)-methyltransferase